MILGETIRLFGMSRFALRRSVEPIMIPIAAFLFRTFSTQVNAEHNKENTASIYHLRIYKKIRITGITGEGGGGRREKDGRERRVCTVSIGNPSGRPGTRVRRSRDGIGAAAPIFLHGGGVFPYRGGCLQFSCHPRPRGSRVRGAHEGGEHFPGKLERRWLEIGGTRGVAVVDGWSQQPAASGGGVR